MDASVVGAFERVTAAYLAAIEANAGTTKAKKLQSLFKKGVEDENKLKSLAAALKLAEDEFTTCLLAPNEFKEFATRLVADETTHTAMEAYLQELRAAVGTGDKAALFVATPSPPPKKTNKLAAAMTSRKRSHPDDDAAPATDTPDASLAKPAAAERPTNAPVTKRMRLTQFTLNLTYNPDNGDVMIA